MCGEHFRVKVRVSKRPGSSPHVRGALHGLNNRLACRGIIPACAGSTPMLMPSKPNARDHPRMCGEHLLQVVQRQRRTGSSPHVRGARIVFDWTVYDPGIIPACAGSTQRNRDYCLLSGDHPRMCGEHFLQVFEGTPF